MAEVYKVLGQADPPATTWTTLYTVPVATSAVIGRMFVTNRDTVEHTFSVRVKVAGAADVDKQLIINDYAIAPGLPAEVCKGMTLGATDVISVYVDAQEVSFNLFGVEVS